MPFQNPLPINNPAYPNEEQPTVNIGHIADTIEAEITNAVIPVSGTVDANILNAQIDVQVNGGTVDANITNANIAATVNGNVIVDSGQVNVGGILTPVVVQGGGTILFSNNVNSVPANGFTDIVIAAPANGQTYYGLNISWEILTSGAGITAGHVSVYTSGFPGVPVTGIAIRDTNAAEIGAIGFTEKIEFTLPMHTTFPLTIRIRNSHASSTMNGYLQVTGSSYAYPYPVDNMQAWFNTGTMQVLASAPAAGDYITLQPSMSTTVYRFQPSTTGLDGNVQVKQWNPSTKVYDLLIARPTHSPYYSGVGVAWDTFEFSCPPVGLPHTFHFNSAFAGNVRLYLAEIKR